MEFSKKIKYKPVSENLPQEQSGIPPKNESTRLFQKTCLKSNMEFTKRVKYKTSWKLRHRNYIENAQNKQWCKNCKSISKGFPL